MGLDNLLRLGEVMQLSAFVLKRRHRATRGLLLILSNSLVEKRFLIWKPLGLSNLVISILLVIFPFALLFSNESLLFYRHIVLFRFDVFPVSISTYPLHSISQESILN